jgi:cytochrome c-type biogenesis protein CcmH/NrfG
MFFLVFVIILNIYSFIYQRSVITYAKQQMSAFNKGESYLGRLNLWHMLVQSGDWETAAKLENQIDPLDISTHKNSYQPSELNKNLSLLLGKKEKSADDWIEIAKFYSLLGDMESAKKAVNQAHQIDPIREDITKLYYQIQK